MFIFLRWHKHCVLLCFMVSDVHRWIIILLLNIILLAKFGIGLEESRCIFVFNKSFVFFIDINDMLVWLPLLHKEDMCEIPFIRHKIWPLKLFNHCFQLRYVVKENQILMAPKHLVFWLYFIFDKFSRFLLC